MFKKINSETYSKVIPKNCFENMKKGILKI